jgi:alpha-glucosidase
VSTLLTDQPSLKGTSSLENITLPPFGSWIGAVE